MTLRVGVLVSGRGSNLQALIDASADGRLDARIVYVGSSRKQAFPPAANGGREAAQLLMAARLRAEEVDLVVLAGFDRILCDRFFERLGPVPVINIHPALLPAFGGMHGIAVHQAVLAAGVPETGVTVHRARAGQLDAGEILVQRRVPVLPGDDAEMLADRVLRTEHEAIVEAVAGFCRSAVRV